MLTMNIQDNGNKRLSAFHNLKLSPDSVVAPMTLGIHERVQPIQREDSIEIPDLKTPPSTPTLIQDQQQGNQSKPPQTSLVQKGLDRLPPLPRGSPKIPPRSPISRAHVRCISEGAAHANMSRRSIFGQYWNQGNRTTGQGQHRGANGIIVDPQSLNTANTTPPPCIGVRRRSSSLSIIDTAGMAYRETMDYRMFAPPPDHAESSLICGRFTSVQESPHLESLPPLPSPLRRFCPEGDVPGCLQGMYPLTTPTPILRQSSYRSIMNNKTTHSGKTTTNTWCGEGHESFNLTKSWRPCRPVSLYAADEDGSAKTRVRFDPRVTVTEFEDSVERSWYNDAELDRLKYDTIVVAKKYLLKHPDQAERYNRATLDPVSGTFRKKALFSLPILSKTEGVGLPAPDHKEYEELLKSQVKTILIVDPNKAILDLFCKSLNSMFPAARLYKAQSGDEALQLASAALKRAQCSQPHGLDIVIVEQRILKATPSGGQGGKARSLQSMSERGELTQPFAAMGKPGSFTDVALQSLGFEICGSQLLKAIQRLEDEAYCVDRSSQTKCKESEASMMCPKPIPRKALLIGVSMHPDRDARELREAGADIVWGKPIPRVGDALRNQLLHLLVDKRCRSLADVHLSEETEKEETA